jgi:hypothetical protein
MARRLKRALALAASVMLFGCAFACIPAAAATSPAITDCVAHGVLTKHYSIRQLKRALSTISAPTREYTNCSDVLNRALAADLSKPGGGKPGGGATGGGSGSFLPVPVIILLVVLILAALALAVMAVRRRGAGGPGPGGPGTAAGEQGGGQAP